MLKVLKYIQDFINKTPKQKGKRGGDNNGNSRKGRNSENNNNDFRRKRTKKSVVLTPQNTAGCMGRGITQENIVKIRRMVTKIMQLINT